MKFLKKNYKLIIGILIGPILISGISVYATSTYLASQVDYKNNKTVVDALDDLYTKTSKYKKLDTTTTATSNDILNGKTAYDNLGNLITGNISTDCVSGTYNKPANGQASIDLGFVPSKVMLKYTLNNDKRIVVYDSSISNNNCYVISGFSSTISVAVTSYFKIEGQFLKTVAGTNIQSYQVDISYWACK